MPSMKIFKLASNLLCLMKYFITIIYINYHAVQSDKLPTSDILLLI